MATEYKPLINCSTCKTFTHHTDAGYRLAPDQINFGEQGYQHLYKCVVCASVRVYGYDTSQPAGIPAAVAAGVK